MELLHMIATTHPTRVMEATRTRGVHRPSGDAGRSGTVGTTTGLVARVRAALTRRPGPAAPACTVC